MKSMDLFDMLAACEVPADSFSDPSADETNAWLAENTVEFFNETYLFYAAATEGNQEWADICKDPINHPKKGFPDGKRYQWREEENGEKSCKQLPADKYIDSLFLWIEGVIDNSAIFPPEEDNPFPSDFEDYLQKIFRRLLRVFIIIYCNKCLYDRTEDKIFKRSIKFFLYFAWKWNLLPLSLEDAAPIETLVKPIRECYQQDKLKSDKKKNGSLTPGNIKASDDI